MSDAAAKAALRAGELPWPCWIEVDLDAIASNVRAIQQLIGPMTSVAAVVKAQAYGHGAVEVARAALEAGAAWLAVARVREGVQLRAVGIEAPILLLGPAEGPEIEVAVEHDLRPTIVDALHARGFSRAAVAARKTVPVHMKIGTGLNRYGIPLEEARVLFRELRELPNLYLEGVYSHFATADETNLQFAEQQLSAFREAVAVLREEGASPEVVHMAASAATMALRGSHFDMVRLGISLYGVYPSPHLRDRVRLLPALAMLSRIARVFHLNTGDSVGYGRTFVADRRLTAGLVPVGYADGLPRRHSNRGAVLVNGQRAPLLGRVSMDQCVVDLTDCGEVAEGMQVVILGTQGAETISIDSFAAISGTISYEALTSLGARVPRVYIRGGMPVSVAYLDEGAVSHL